MSARAHTHTLHARMPGAYPSQGLELDSSARPLTCWTVLPDPGTNASRQPCRNRAQQQQLRPGPQPVTPWRPGAPPLLAPPYSLRSPTPPPDPAPPHTLWPPERSIPIEPGPRYPSRDRSGPGLPTSQAPGDRPGRARCPPAADRQWLPGASAAPSAHQFTSAPGVAHHSSRVGKGRLRGPVVRTIHLRGDGATPTRQLKGGAKLGREAATHTPIRAGVERDGARWASPALLQPRGGRKGIRFV